MFRVLKEYHQMLKYNPNIIHETVTSLKAIKSSAFTSNDGLVDFKQVKETCRIIDTLTLPLYYIWERCCHRQLKELDFEKHLEKPYNKFLQNPLTNTWKLYLLISMGTVFNNKIGKLSEKVSILYKGIVDHYEEFEGVGISPNIKRNAKKQ